jgi:hypothetical protein
MLHSTLSPLSAGANRYAILRKVIDGAVSLWKTGKNHTLFYQCLEYVVGSQYAENCGDRGQTGQRRSVTPAVVSSRGLATHGCSLPRLDRLFRRIDDGYIRGDSPRSQMPPQRPGETTVDSLFEGPDPSLQRICSSGRSHRRDDRDR